MVLINPGALGLGRGRALCHLCTRSEEEIGRHNYPGHLNEAINTKETTKQLALARWNRSAARLGFCLVIASVHCQPDRN